MKKIINLLLIMSVISVFVSCSRPLEWSKSENGTVIIKAPGIRFKDVTEVPWKTGKSKKVQISKGLRFELSLPNPDKELRAILTSDYAADSWLISVGRVNNRGATDLLGNIMLHFPTRADSFSDMMQASFYVKYAALMPSSRFEQFECPAFGHNLKIESISHENSGNSTVEFVLLPKSPDGKRVRFQKKQEIGMPIQFNGGSHLKGRFHFKVALYNSNTQTLVSALMPMENDIVVDKEVETLIPGCGNFEIPEDKLRGVNKADTFQFKKN